MIKSIKKNGKIKTFLAFIVVVTVLFMMVFSMKPAESLVKQKPLPYSENALEPYISAKTMSLHYGKHHAGYVTATNRLLENSDLKGKSHEEIVKLSAKDIKQYSALFNNAAQAWNHEFFWESISPAGGGNPDKELTIKFNESFGSYDQFKSDFILAARQLFGSGWVWLVIENNNLKIMTTCNADTPLAHGQTPLFTIDVWEHAYYLDYQQNRGEYVELLLEHLIDWGNITKRIDAK